MAKHSFKLTWRQGSTAPQNMSAQLGAAVVHGNTAYFSYGRNMYSYTLARDKWTTIQPCTNSYFGLAVVNNKVTTLGGWSRGSGVTNSLLCLEDHGTKWKKLLPEMPKATIGPATVTTPTHLVVAGGRTRPFHYGDSNALLWIQVLDIKTLQWSLASSSPKASEHPCLLLCGEHIYLSNHNMIFSCSIEELVKSCKPASTNSSDSGSVWTKLADIPVPYHTTLTTLRGHVLAIGDSAPTGSIHLYSKNSNSWSVIGEMPTPHCLALVAVLPSNKLITVGGVDGRGRDCNITNIASTE